MVIDWSLLDYLLVIDWLIGLLMACLLIDYWLIIGWLIIDWKVILCNYWLTAWFDLLCSQANIFNNFKIVFTRFWRETQIPHIISDNLNRLCLVLSSDDVRPFYGIVHETEKWSPIWNISRFKYNTFKQHKGHIEVRSWSQRL